MESAEVSVLDSSSPVIPARSTRPDISRTVTEIAGVIGAWCP